MWSAHKFGGTCMGTAERIQSFANIILGDPSERKLVVVSAMSKVTDMMYNLVFKAQLREDSYASALDDVYEKHMLTAKQLLDGDDLVRFLSQLQNDISNLKAMLQAIYIDLISETESSLEICLEALMEIPDTSYCDSTLVQIGFDCRFCDCRSSVSYHLPGSLEIHAY